METFSVLLRRTRERLTLTQDQLAGRCGLSGRTIRRLETAESAPRLSTLRALADALDLDPTERDRFRRTAGFGLGATGPAGFGVLLQRARERILLTQEQLAKRSGVSLRAILRLEAGHNGLTVATLRVLADALDLDPTERDGFLLTAADGRPRLPPDPSVSTSAEAAIVFGALLRQTREQMMLTQEHVAERAMLGVRVVRRLEAGDSNGLMVATLRALADALDLDPTERDGFLLTAADGRPRLHLRRTGRFRENTVTAEQFGALIRQTRERLMLTQEQLAERAMLGVRVVRRLEAGDSNGLMVATLRALADALDLDPTERDRFLSTITDGRRLVR